jgi:hypothetical protein
VVSDSPSETTAEEGARLAERCNRALEALMKATRSGGREELEAAGAEWESADRDFNNWNATAPLKLAAEMLMRPPTGEAPAHD